ncbi:hypothetical protein GE21DRAFT_5768 [Neurospora crassa]|uniref:GRF zinc finger domain-containing protein n=1 Tax=Neurospora crassa (strain ATCC 24698 / 74-OR23-1A / CBS 708.71 / DSM 1257 / FGSC 987) TaxID=367110 RepID=Q7S9N7_NEUCR|nr:GRF zinc finger domain-containing protein [Neurospora crassa OR74A]EAA33069.2 GRF zinc finger domain-containing protein [Neurospora crassa OR74A]KHE84731.1 hypothetical protein GE21DRAFT_5768 [Neurospora crassa]|eukprot:XP_962305.2 GRF zinc finger domain-containing protein [Neurospora crassa OR74A]
MDRFITRGKRKAELTLEENVDTTQIKQTITAFNNPIDNTPDGDGESTDIKLAILASLHPDFGHDALLDLLITHDGSVEATTEALKSAQGAGQIAKKKSSGIISQASLRSFAVPSTTGDGDHGGASIIPKKPKLLSRKGATLHLYDPSDISTHTPCTVIHNFLPPSVANSLLVELLEEAKTFGKATFKLFDNVVSSPHTSCFFVGSDYELAEQKSAYFYNGARLSDIRRLTPQLETVRPLVQDAVNTEIQKRIRTHHLYGGKKLKYQSPDRWSPNAAFVNLYDGPEQNVGWHSDQLTYLGPRAVIGSLSLGVAREFRVRRILPKDKDQDGNSSSTTSNANLDSLNEGQISIHLPHNSLLVMHADMQEEWKHCVTPAQAIDPHPIAGKRRINVTYRDYRPEFHPRYTPRCACGIPTILRVVQKKRENWGRYFWMCHAGNQPGKEACSFFQWAEFDDDGRPLWKKGTGTRTAGLEPDTRESAQAPQSPDMEQQSSTASPEHAPSVRTIQPMAK